MVDSTVHHSFCYAYLIVIHTGSPLSLASTIFCFRRWSQMRESTT